MVCFCTLDLKDSERKGTGLMREKLPDAVNQLLELPLNAGSDIGKGTGNWLVRIAPAWMLFPSASIACPFVREDTELYGNVLWPHVALLMLLCSLWHPQLYWCSPNLMLAVDLAWGSCPVEKDNVSWFSHTGRLSQNRTITYISQSPFWCFMLHRPFFFFPFKVLFSLELLSEMGT